MYRLAVQRKFVAQHFLIGGDWGEENEKHSHHYVLELQLEGNSLNEHGYVVDIVNVEAALDDAVAFYKDRTLNELPDFDGLNPSIENFTRIVAHQLAPQVNAPNLSSLQVRIWENDIAWAAYTMHLND